MVSQYTSGVQRRRHSKPTTIDAKDWHIIVPTGYHFASSKKRLLMNTMLMRDSSSSVNLMPNRL
jgi:hypothetical protein